MERVIDKVALVSEDRRIFLTALRGLEHGPAVRGS